MCVTRWTRYQVCGEVDKVSIVLIDEFNHGTPQHFQIHIQVVPQGLQLNMSSPLHYKSVHIKLSLKRRETKRYINYIWFFFQFSNTLFQLLLYLAGFPNQFLMF